MARLQTIRATSKNYTADAELSMRTPLASLRAVAENARDNTSADNTSPRTTNIRTLENIG